MWGVKSNLIMKPPEGYPLVCMDWVGAKVTNQQNQINIKPGLGQLVVQGDCINSFARASMF